MQVRSELSQLQPEGGAADAEPVGERPCAALRPHPGLQPRAWRVSRVPAVSAILVVSVS